MLAQPLFQRLHACQPALALDVLAPAWTVPLFERMPEVRRSIAAPLSHGKLEMGARWKIARVLAHTHYDRAIVLPNSFKSALIPFFARIPRRSGYVGEWRWPLLNDIRKLDKQGVPLLAERYAGLADVPVPANEPLGRPHLVVDNTERAGTLARLGLDLQRPITILCPGAEYGSSKRWPAPYFGAIARKLIAGGDGVWVLGSAKDSALGAEITTSGGADCVNLCGKTTLREAIDILSCASMVVANDSGLMHIAAALDKPLIALYGSTSPTYTPPLSPRARIMTLKLDCSPCFARECPLGHFNCMRNLTPDHVFKCIEQERSDRAGAAAAG